MYKLLQDKVINNGKCCGCGVCVAACPHDQKMMFDKVGQLKPIFLKCSECGLCLKVCPFYNKDEYVLKDQPFGDYISCCVGFSNDDKERSRSASGGMVTRISKILLEEKLVDAVVSVGDSSRGDSFFEARIVDTEEVIFPRKSGHNEELG